MTVGMVRVIPGTRTPGGGKVVVVPLIPGPVNPVWPAQSAPPGTTACQGYGHQKGLTTKGLSPCMISHNDVCQQKKNVVIATTLDDVLCTMLPMPSQCMISHNDACQVKRNVVVVMTLADDPCTMLPMPQGPCVSPVVPGGTALRPVSEGVPLHAVPRQPTQLTVTPNCPTPDATQAWTEPQRDPTPWTYHDTVQPCLPVNAHSTTQSTVAHRPYTSTEHNTTTTDDSVTIMPLPPPHHNS